jgi:hypothetical protein
MIRPFKLFQIIFPIRPLRMYRRGRRVVTAFQPDEQLYRRFRRNDAMDGVILPSALQFPNKDDNTGQSANRSLFSLPEDALWTDNEKLDGWGVFRFPASCLPEEAVCSQTQRRFTFFPRHVPLRKNYAHSEVWCDELPRTNSAYVLPTKIVKKEFRARIQKYSQIVIPAEV